MGSISTVRRRRGIRNWIGRRRWLMRRSMPTRGRNMLTRRRSVLPTASMRPTRRPGIAGAASTRRASRRTWIGLWRGRGGQGGATSLYRRSSRDATGIA